MKYITTSKHPELKEGLIFEYWSDSAQWVCGPSKFYKVMVNQLEALLEKGYIKEVEEPEFTKTDIEDAIDFATERTFGASTTLKDIVKLWIKNKAK